jgi:hypothetical protein
MSSEPDHVHSKQRVNLRLASSSLLFDSWMVLHVDADSQRNSDPSGAEKKEVGLPLTLVR